VQAADAELADDAQVIGIVAGSKSRAYFLDAMRTMSGHVINDLVDDVPVTLTYCDFTDVPRVLTTSEQGTPINLWLGGFSKGQLAVRFNEQQYTHTSKDIPLDDYPFTRTTWKAWREANPETEVYIGGGRPDIPDLPVDPLTVMPTVDAAAVPDAEPVDAPRPGQPPR
jgi:hypothetical protein